MDPAVPRVATGMALPADDTPPPELGKVGIWANTSKLSGALAHEVEQLGYGAIWIGGSPGDDLAIVDELLGATESIVVATGIVNIWKDDARTIAAAHRRITGTYPGRFLLGVGVGHPEATSDYTRPYKALVDYLDVLDGEGVPVHQRALAALGPKVLRLSADRSAGAHPYLTTPEHTRAARDVLGAGVLLAPEQKLVLDADPTRARPRPQNCQVLPGSDELRVEPAPPGVHRRRRGR